MTLFLISRYYNNFLYYNLKTIRTLKKKDENVKIQNIITESCKYLDLAKEQIDELSSLIKNNRLFSFFTCLKEITKFLIKHNLSSVIILDQFKSDSIDKEEYNEILLLISKQEIKNVKILICSSTNDKEIRKECIQSWKLKIFFLYQLNEANQNYYFYIDELYNKNKTGNNTYDIILSEFNYIPKYKNKFKYLKDEKNTTEKLNKDLEEIKGKVEENLKKLYRIINGKDQSEEIITMKMIESLRYIHINIGEQLDYKKLDEFSNICSFKYYRFKFEINNFIINYNFPYMITIVNDITNTHLEDFYKYERKNEHSGSANADFFELFSGKSIKKGNLKLPESKETISIKVNEIVEMKEFSKVGLDNSIQNLINSHLEKYTVKNENFIKENEEIKEELKERNLLLSLNDIIDYNGKDIEYYKLQYMNQLKEEYTISGNKNLGNMSIFINQENQRGKKLDLAYVYGKNDEKIFIGFQMKAYDEESSHDCKFDITKDNLKSELKPMTVNIKYLLGIDIKSWHYVTIILLDKRKQEGMQYIKNIVEICKNNGLDYIFCEPFENKFYNRNFEEITEFIPNQFSNLDNNFETILPINIMDELANKYMDYFSDYMLKNNLSNANYIEQGLTSLINKKRKRTKSSTSTGKDKKQEIKNILNDILYNLKIKFAFKCIKFVGAYEFLKTTINIPTPQKDYFFLIPSSEKEMYFILFNIQNINDLNDNNIYYKYNTDLKIDIFDKKTILESIIPVEPNDINANINKKEKFYAFIFDKNKKF